MDSQQTQKKENPSAVKPHTLRMIPSAESDIENVIRQKGGITIDFRFGKQPIAGFAVAPSKRTECQVPLADFSAAHVSDYIRKFQKVLELPGMCFGARVKDGVVYLDVSLVVEDVITAAALAEEADQWAVRCLHDACSIPTEEAATQSQIARERRSERYGALRKAINQELQ